MDERGNYFICDRAKELIKCSGISGMYSSQELILVYILISNIIVAPAEIESMLLSINNVLDCAVIGVPHPLVSLIPALKIVC
jgi:acyl-coenzyme A synthetase/AMP-(fatty) acid ligase